MSDQKSFTTERLHLRPLTLDHAPAYARHFIDYEVISQLSAAIPWPYPESGVRDFILNVVIPNQGRGRWAWGLFLKTNPDELIGAIDLWRDGKPEHRGFWLGRAFWGQGLMAEAVVPITDHAFNDLGFETLVFSNALGNRRSRRIKEKMGARLIGTRPARFVNPNYVEAETWELTKAEWQSRPR